MLKLFTLFLYGENFTTFVANFIDSLYVFMGKFPHPSLLPPLHGWWDSHLRQWVFQQLHLFFFRAISPIIMKHSPDGNAAFSWLVLAIYTGYDISTSQNQMTCFITHDWIQLHALMLWHNKGIYFVYSFLNIQKFSNKISFFFCQDYIPTVSFCLCQTNLLIFHLLLLFQFNLFFFFCIKIDQTWYLLCRYETSFLSFCQIDGICSFCLKSMLWSSGNLFRVQFTKALNSSSSFNSLSVLLNLVISNWKKACLKDLFLILHSCSLFQVFHAYWSLRL